MIMKSLKTLIKISAAALIAASAALAWQPAAYPSDAQQEDSINKSGKIHISADKLVSVQKSNYIQFMGNVDAVREGTRIKSADLKVFFHKMPGPGSEAGMGGKNIEKIVATENVKIHFDNRTAECRKAVYLTGEETLILTGESVTIKSEDNSIIGEKVTYNRRTGELIVDGSPAQRVNAVIHQAGGENSKTGTGKNSP